MIFIPAYGPYLILTVISFILIFLAWIRSKKVKLLPFYLCISGLIYLFELTVFVFFNSYRYSPGVFKEHFYDSCLGALISNGLIVPSSCALIAVFPIGFRWILLMAAGFMGIEELFIYLGVYEHVWWKTLYTGISLTMFFLIGKWLWRKINETETPFYIRLIVVYLINVSLQSSLFFFYIVLFHQFEYRPGWFEDTARDNIAFTSVLVHLDSILFALIVTLRANWIWKAILIAGLGSFFIWLNRRGILFVSGHWPVILFLILLQIAVVQLLNRLYLMLTSRSGAHRHLRQS